MIQQLHMRGATYAIAQLTNPNARRRLRAALQALAAHAANTKQRRAAVEAFAVRRKERSVRVAIFCWSGWAATQRRLREMSDIVRPFALLPIPRHGTIVHTTP